MKAAFKTFRRHTFPPPGVKVEVLCALGGQLEIAPFLCCWTDEGWVVAGTRRSLRYAVAGWRYPLGLLPGP